jgi:hypothetical protein
MIMQPCDQVFRMASVEPAALLALENVAEEHMEGLVGPARFELATSPLSGVRSNQLSYEPVFNFQTFQSDLPDCRDALTN